MSKTRYSELLYQTSFSDKVSKQAYLEACKWLAQNVYSKVELSKWITVQITKEQVKKKQLPTFTVKLFITVDEKEMKDSYCGKCKQLHTIFYSIDTPNCDTCKLNGYRKQLNSSVKNAVEFWKEVFENGNER